MRRSRINFLSSPTSSKDKYTYFYFYFYLDLDESMNEGAPDEGEYDDASSDGSGFVGSLGIEIVSGTWQSDLRVQLDLQLGREEWQTSFSAIDGGKLVSKFSALISFNENLNKNKVMKYEIFFGREMLTILMKIDLFSLKLFSENYFNL